jgi:hypothetical protein
MLLQAQREGGGILQTIPQSDTRKRWVVSTTMRSLYPREGPVPTVWTSELVTTEHKIPLPRGI